jgi:hypothetical protein
MTAEGDFDKHKDKVDLLSLLSKLTAVGMTNTRFLGRSDRLAGVLGARLPASAVPITQGTARAA